MSCNNNNIVPSCGCPSPCDNPIACGCQIKINTECVTNTVDLPQSGVERGQTLDETLLGIDTYLSELISLIQNISNGFIIQNVGGRVPIFKGVSGTGVREFRTLESVDTNTMTITQDGDIIKFEVQPTTPTPLSVTSTPTSRQGQSLVESYANDILNLRSINSQTLSLVTTSSGTLFIELPFSATSFMSNKLLKNPNQLTSVQETAPETSILGTFTGTNVFTPEEMVPNTSYDILFRGRFTRTAKTHTPESSNNGVFRFRLSGVDIGSVTLSPRYGFSSADIEGNFELAFQPRGSAIVTGKIKLVNNTNREVREYPITSFSAGGLDLSTNKTLNITYTPPSNSEITTQINKIQINKVR